MGEKFDFAVIEWICISRYYATFGDEIFNMTVCIRCYFIVPRYWIEPIAMLVIGITVFFVFTIPVGFDFRQVVFAIGHIYAYNTPKYFLRYISKYRRTENIYSLTWRHKTLANSRTCSRGRSGCLLTSWHDSWTDGLVVQINNTQKYKSSAKK